MTPGERLDHAQEVFDQMGMPNTEPNYVCFQALIAIGRLLQNIDNRQSGATTP